MGIAALAVAASKTFMAFTEGVGSTVGIYAIIKGSKSYASKRRR